MNPNSSTQRVQNIVKAQARKLQGRWRKAITGSSTKRVRDHIREVQEVPKNIKLLDKVGFTLGVLNILACQYFLLNVPRYFQSWYAVIVPITLVSRFYHFKSLNFHYFLIDFCYFTIFNTFLNISLLRWSARFFKICFIFSTGVLPIAIPIWRNSFIFHDFDKIVSVYIHLLPCMLYYTLRWNGLSNSESMTCEPNGIASCEPLYISDYFYAILIYIFWQIAYLLKTEVLDKEKFDSHPEIQTSLRWLARDTKNDFSRMILKGLRRMGIFGQQEDFDSTTMKTKMVFVCCQLLLTLVSFIPTPLFYYSNFSHLFWIGLIFTISIFNGASFYIEVFSVRYQAQLKKLDEMQKIARDATSMMQQMAADIDASQEGAKRHKASTSPATVPSLKLSPKKPNNKVKSSSFSSRSKLSDSTKEDANSEIQNVSASLIGEDDSPETRGDELDLSEDETIRDILEHVSSYDYDFLDQPE